MQSEVIGTSDWRAYVDDRVRKHDRDLYEGDGKEDPSICTRLDRCEQFMERSTQAQERSASNSFRIQILLAGAMLTAIADIVVHRLH